MKKFIFISIMLLAAGFAFSQQNTTARTVAEQEGIKAQLPDPATGQVPVDNPGTVSADDAEIKAMLQKNEDFYNSFQDKFKTLKTYNATKQQKDELKVMQAMIDRQKRLVDLKMEEIQIMERANKTISLGEFTQLKDLMNRYHSMTVDLNNWVNKIK